MRAHPPLAVAALAVSLLLLAGCTAGGDADPQTTPTASMTADTGPNGADDAGIDGDDPPEALASTRLERGGEEGIDSTLIEVVAMRHVDRVLVLTVRVTPEGEESGTGRILATQALDGSFLPVLLDYDNLKRYGDVTELRSSDTQVGAPMNRPMYLTATFAYPEGADAVDIQINGVASPLEAVPVP